MTLDPADAGQSLNASATPPGYSQTIEFLASGATPGVLKAGESGSVDVYFAGWLKSAWDYAQPAVSFSVDLISADSTAPFDWSTVESSSACRQFQLRLGQRRHKSPDATRLDLGKLRRPARRRCRVSGRIRRVH